MNTVSGACNRKKADYQRIADTYDAARPLSEQNLELWLKLISERIPTHRKVKLLDLGCGTGRFSIPIAAKPKFSVTGADSSKEMLSKAKRKKGSTQVKWDIQDASSLSYADSTFDAVFMSHLLHHVDHPLTVVRECYRVLRPEGVILNRYAPIEDISDDPEHRFFPETLKIDEARIPTLEQVEKWFRTAGFKDISSMTIIQRSFESAEDRLKKTELKCTSVLSLISPQSFKQGLDALRKYISENPNDPWLTLDRMTLTTGTKPESNRKRSRELSYPR